MTNSKEQGKRIFAQGIGFIIGIMIAFVIVSTINFNVATAILTLGLTTGSIHSVVGVLYLLKNDKSNS